MKQFLITVAGVVVGGILCFFVAIFGLFSFIGMAASSAGPVQPAHMVLELDLREGMTDQTPSTFAVFGGAPSLLDTMARIDAARTDDRVDGIFIRAATDAMSPAQAEELRASLAQFRESGKFVVAHIQGDGARLSMPGYMAVAGADDLWLQQASDFLPMGLSSEMTFFGDTLRRYHLEAQFEARENYKTAANEITQNRLTPAHREQVEGLLNGLYTVMLGNIAADREIDPAQVRAVIDGTPYTSERAVELKLVDRLGWPEAAARAALERSEHDNAQMIPIGDYSVPSRGGGGDVIAVVQGEGAINSGPPSNDIFADESEMNSDRVAQALLDAANDDDVKAIVFRVSSPGGSAVASDQILAALRTAREAKPVVVSMGDVAASGGYYVATHANEIVASPTTITGSIGVISGKLIIGGALEHYLSANTETVTVGSPMAEMWTSTRPFTQAERAVHAQHVDRLYATFVGLVSDGRRIPVDQVRALAGGRVWTGQQALELRLVDHLGGFHVAVQRARALAEIGENERVQLRYYPAQDNPFKALEGFFGMSSESVEALARVNALMSDPRFERAMAAIREEDTGVRAEAGRMEVR